MMIFFPILAKAFPRLASSRPFTLAIFAARRPIITTPPPLLGGRIERRQPRGGGGVEGGY